MAKALTEKQQNIFDFLRETISESGYPPTVREIGDRFGITVKGAYDHLKAIEKKGYIKTQQNKSRAIVIVGEENSHESGDNISIPVVGRIAAGLPILAEENIENHISFSASMLGTGNFFALHVSGDSMVEGGINDGDIAIIKQQETANNGEIIAALLDDEATLKEFRKHNDHVELVPHNSSYEPIKTRELSILGKLVAIFRQY